MAHGISGPRRNKSEGAAQSRGAERKRRFHRKILAHHPFQRGRAGRRAGPPLFAFFHRPPRPRTQGRFPALVFLRRPRVWLAPFGFVRGQGAVRENEQIAFLHVFAPHACAGAKKWRKCVVFFKFNACAHPFGRRRGRLCMPGLPLKMGNGKIFCFMVYWLVTEYMPAQRRAVRACRPFT